MGMGIGKGMGMGKGQCKGYMVRVRDGVGWVCDVMRVVKIRVYSISFVYGIRYMVRGI